MEAGDTLCVSQLQAVSMCGMDDNQMTIHAMIISDDDAVLLVGTKYG